MIWELLFATAGFIGIILGVILFFYILRKKDQKDQEGKEQK